jgi:hypothetical protein
MVSAMISGNLPERQPSSNIGWSGFGKDEGAHGQGRLPRALLGIKAV